MVAVSVKHEMSITWQGNTKVVNYPVSESTNTDILEVKQVVLTDTATIVHFNAYYIPFLRFDTHLLSLTLFICQSFFSVPSVKLNDCTEEDNGSNVSENSASPLSGK